MHEWNLQCLRDGKQAVFDLSEFPQYKEACKRFAGTVGLFKHEQGENEMLKAAWAAPKNYVTICMAGKEMKCKGLPKGVLKKNYTYESFENAILLNNAPPAAFRAMVSKNHVKQHQLLSKASLTADNIKVFQLSPYKSRPLGHYKNDIIEDTAGWEPFELEEDRQLKQLEIELAEPKDLEIIDEEQDEDCEDSDYELADDEFSDCD